MNDEIKKTVKDLSSACSRLKEGTERGKTELEIDGVIQRFEFTFELLWKTLKLYLKEVGIKCYSPKECLKEAFRYGLFFEDQTFLDMLKDRNKTTHIYNEEDSRKIFNRIKSHYYPAIVKLAKELKIRIANDK
jgi:nucleotidyltransferase substrate binding protein (TIGR01987 family)